MPHTCQAVPVGACAAVVVARVEPDLYQNGQTQFPRQSLVKFSMLLHPATT